MTEPRLHCWPGCHAEIVGADQPNRGLRVIVIERDTATSEMFAELAWLVQPLGLAKVQRWPEGTVGETCAALPCADAALRPLDPRFDDVSAIALESATFAKELE